MSLEEHPRLVNEVPRGSKHYHEIKNLRSAAERSNATLKEDLGILVNPRVMDIKRANILVQLSSIVLLLVKALRFIVQTTLECRGEQKSKSEPKNKTKSPKIPTFLRNMVQLE